MYLKAFLNVIRILILTNIIIYYKLVLLPSPQTVVFYSILLYSLPRSWCNILLPSPQTVVFSGQRAESPAEGCSGGDQERYKCFPVICSSQGRTPEKSSCSFGFCPNYPLPLIWTTCTNFFRRRNSRFKSQLRTKNTMHTI